MRIMGVDPGTIRMGFGIIDFEKNSYQKISGGIIKLASIKDIPPKLDVIYTEITKLIKEYKPDEFAIETAFYGRNVQSALKIGYAKGAAILAAFHQNLPIAEYSPREVKRAVSGTGAANKEQVSFMTKSILNIKNDEMYFDESDALAVALCHAFRCKMPTQKAKSWKSFIEENPDRVIE